MTHIDFGITSKTFPLLMKTFDSYPEIEEVVLFGSRAKGSLLMFWLILKFQILHYSTISIEWEK